MPAAEVPTITEAPEPGLSEITEVNRGSIVESAGYVYIWDTQTAKRSVCNRNMLQTTLGKPGKMGAGYSLRSNLTSSLGAVSTSACSMRAMRTGSSITN
jgi:hypothetical protein